MKIPREGLPVPGHLRVEIRLHSCSASDLMSALNSSTLHFVSGEDNQLVVGAVGVATILAAVVVYFNFSFKGKEHEFPKLPGVQLYHAWESFQQRYDFLQLNLKRYLEDFSFNVLNRNVIALTGADARQTFFSNPHFNIEEGYRILVGVVCISLLWYKKNRSTDLNNLSSPYKSVVWMSQRKKTKTEIPPFSTGS